MAPGLGVSAVGGLGSLTPYRPYFLGLAVLTLGWTFYRHYKNRVSDAWGNGLGAVLTALRPATGKDIRLLLATGLVVLLLTFPQWGRPYLGMSVRGRSPWVRGSPPVGQLGRVGQANLLLSDVLDGLDGNHLGRD